MKEITFSAPLTEEWKQDWHWLLISPFGDDSERFLLGEPKSEISKSIKLIDTNDESSHELDPLNWKEMAKETIKEITKAKYIWI